MSARKKRKIIDHLTECPACREEFRLYSDLQKFPLREYLGGADSEAAGPQQARRHAAFPLWRFAAVAVGAFLIISTAVLVMKNNEISETERVGAAGIALVSPVSSLPVSEELVFRWEAFEEAQYYIVELFDEDLLPLWASSPVKDTQIRLPHDRRFANEAGAVCFWMVTAYSDSAKIGESRLARFKIASKR
ncbi:MAG TPA: hypothetical protein PLP83_02245 [Candidatus Aminicenantes bacterium]|nr:hypothetical protein [Candidatus Aminicenantes bacterium]